MYVQVEDNDHQHPYYVEDPHGRTCTVDDGSFVYEIVEVGKDKEEEQTSLQDWCLEMYNKYGTTLYFEKKSAALVKMGVVESTPVDRDVRGWIGNDQQWRLTTLYADLCVMCGLLGQLLKSGIGRSDAKN